MRRRRLFVLLLVPVAMTLSAAPAFSAPPSNDPPTAAKIAATWLAHQVNDQGFIPQAADPSAPNLSSSVQAVLALASAGVGRTQVDALLAYFGGHVDDLVVTKGNDDPGALSYLILGVVAAGGNARDFGAGHVDLVTRLENTRQANGLFGAADPMFDGAFRQGLSLLALHAVGRSDTAAADWLVGQQCADGSWTPFRIDTTVPCPAVDPNTFSGPDTNSTSLAALGLKAQGRTAPATEGADALLAVRNADDAWGFLAASDQATDANSTGVVLAALRAIKQSQDAPGVAALLALQIGCDGDPADVGGIAFQSSPDGLVPDVLATNQAILGLADVVLPIGPATISPDLTAACAPATTTTTTTTTSTSTTAVPTPTTGAQASASPRRLPRTGASVAFPVGVALMSIGAGGMLVQLADTRRRHSS
jgi:hypothetical protein